MKYYSEFGYRRYDIRSLKRKLELEQICAADAYQAYRYALYHLKARFALGEAAILTDPVWSCLYALYVIKGQWTEAEAIIATDSIMNQKYWDFILTGNL